jgi:hypothetical protein
VLVLLEGVPAPGLPFLRQLHWIVTPNPASERSTARLMDAAQVAGSLLPARRHVERNGQARRRDATAPAGRNGRATVSPLFCNHGVGGSNPSAAASSIPLQGTTEEPPRSISAATRDRGTTVRLLKDLRRLNLMGGS